MNFDNNNDLTELYIHKTLGDKLQIEVDITDIGQESWQNKLVFGLSNNGSIRLYEVWVE